VAVIVLPRISKYPLSCWRRMIVDAVSETASQYLLEEDDEEE
jgi:predicted nucleic acid-binding protein